MKLELKHLAPYLPYHIKCQWNGQTITICGLNLNSESIQNVCLTETAPFEEIELLLRPISDIDTQILINDLHSKMSDAILEWIDYFNSDSQNKDMAIVCAPYPVIDWCFENHFDVFNLIHNQLAVAK